MISVKSLADNILRILIQSSTPAERLSIVNHQLGRCNSLVKRQDNQLTEKLFLCKVENVSMLGNILQVKDTFGNRDTDVLDRNAVLIGDTT